MEAKKVDSAFEVHILTDDGKNKARNLAADFDELLEKVKAVCPEGRELSLVRTKLEEACFFAKKGMARANGTPA